VFQDKHGLVFTINHEGPQRQMGAVVVQGHDILTLVDADGAFCQPDGIILNAIKLRILLTSSPRHRSDRRWLTQDVHDKHASYVIGPWLWDELAVASFVTSV
jgi:hypothetical protein